MRTFFRGSHPPPSPFLAQLKKSDKVATQLKAQGDLIGLISFQIVFGLGLAKV